VKKYYQLDQLNACDKLFYLFIYLSVKMSQLYIRTLATQQGYKTLTAACLKLTMNVFEIYSRFLSA